jgi:hypothetical protein
MPVEKNGGLRLNTQQFILAGLLKNFSDSIAADFLHAGAC